MKRTQIYLSEEQHELLRRLAFEQHKSISQVIRDIVDVYCKSAGSTSRSKVLSTSEESLESKKKRIEQLEADIKEKAAKALEPETLLEAQQVTESLKGFVSKERYDQLTSALEEYRKSLEKLSEYP